MRRWIYLLVLAAAMMSAHIISALHVSAVSTISAALAQVMSAIRHRGTVIQFGVRIANLQNQPQLLKLKQRLLFTADKAAEMELQL